MPIEIQSPTWRAKNAKPPRPGWYYVRGPQNERGQALYFDDTPRATGGSWWHSTAANGWTPNDTFSEWLLVPEIHA